MRMELFGCGNHSRKQWISVDNAVLEKDGNRPQSGPLVWRNGREAVGFIEDARLNGNYLVHFKFDEVELRSWLIAHSKDNPMSALKLIADAQSVAVASLEAAAQK